MYKVNKQKCTGCGVCMANCPGATKLGADGKAEIIDQEKLEKCGGEDLCPLGAIEKVSEEGKPEQQAPPSSPPYGSPPAPSPYGPSPPSGRGLGMGRGPGWSRGMGRKRRGGRG